MSKISPCLWFDGQAEEAARFYVSLLPNSRIDRIMNSPLDTPAGGATAGKVLLVEFTLAGETYQALNGGPNHRFTPAVSLSVTCEDEAEVDRLWAALAEGGKEVACGWVEDRYGLSWQIVPKGFIDIMNDPDRARAKRAMTAMMDMVKLDLAALRKAADGP